MEYLQYYDLETYLFTKVSARFAKEKSLSAFDFFCIMVWKANRSKSRVAKILSKKGYADLESAVRDLTTSLARIDGAKDRLKHLIVTWGFRLPIASAILTVLYPEEFTVYDQRVCGQLNNFHGLLNTTDFDKLWTDYERYKVRVHASAPRNYSLRDKDRYLWAKSYYEQLENDIKRSFKKK